MGPYGENNNNSSGLRGRLMIAVIIALFGIITYFSNTQENPVTHEKQHLSLSPQQEILLGIQSAPQMTKEMGGDLSSTDPRFQEVRKIGEILMAHSNADKSPWKFQFHLLADKKTINAFALPGGQVFITLGLYDNLRTEAQLAGVLGHEMGHVIERHSAQQMAKSELGNILVGAVAVGASNQDYSSQHGFNPAVIAAFVNQMVQLRYSRHDESQADLWGVKLMVQAGYDPKAMIEVLEILKRTAGSGNMPEIFESHPNPDLRIQQIKQLLAEHPPKAGLTEGGRIPQ